MHAKVKLPIYTKISGIYGRFYMLRAFGHILTLAIYKRRQTGPCYDGCYRIRITDRIALIFV